MQVCLIFKQKEVRSPIVTPKRNMAVFNSEWRQWHGMSYKSRVGSQPNRCLPDCGTNLGLVLGEVDVLEDHVLSVAHKIVIVLVAEITSVRLSIVESRASVLSVIFQLFVDHIRKKFKLLEGGALC